MNPPKLLVFFVLGMLVTGGAVRAQVEVKGTVYDISAQNPVRGVSVGCKRQGNADGFAGPVSDRGEYQ
jgi:hypothetical protein